MTKTPDTVIVNGVSITEDDINGELLHHTAQNFPEAHYKATRALVARELLIQRAIKLGLITEEDARSNPEHSIDVVLEAELELPEVSEDLCREVYHDNKDRFGGAPMCEASHILYSARPDNEDEMANAKAQAEAALARLQDNPELFEEIARAESACPSSERGGSLGEVRRGQMVPPFEEAVFSMQEGEISQTPVATNFGYHLIQITRCIDSAPFEEVADDVRAFVSDRARSLAINAYLSKLAKSAKIKNFEF